MRYTLIDHEGAGLRKAFCMSCNFATLACNHLTDLLIEGDKLAAVEKERDAYLANLTSTQTRCTELLETLRSYDVKECRYCDNPPKGEPAILHVCPKLITNAPEQVVYLRQELALQKRFIAELEETIEGGGI